MCVKLQIDLGLGRNQGYGFFDAFRSSISLFVWKQITTVKADSTGIIKSN